MATLSIRLSEDLEEKLEQEARLRETNRSEVAREALADYLRRQERERFMAHGDRSGHSQPQPYQRLLSNLDRSEPVDRWYEHAEAEVGAIADRDRTGHRTGELDAETVGET